MMDEQEYESHSLQAAESAAIEGATYYDPYSPTLWKRFILGPVSIWRRLMWTLFPPSLSALMEMQRRRQDGALEANANASGPSEAASSALMPPGLEVGDVERAAQPLEHSYFVTGEVIHGDGRGRKIGFPTANLRLDPSSCLRHGVYVVEVRIAGCCYGGVANYGRRPTFDNGAPLLEIYVFDFYGDLYGRKILVQFLDFIRGEQKFASLHELKQQIKADVALAHLILQKQKT